VNTGRTGTGAADLDAADLGAVDLAQALRSGRIDVREHTESVLALAAERGPGIGAFAHLLPELSRRQADAAHARLAPAQGSAAARDELAQDAPLLGVPLPIKDLTQIEGLPFEAGSVILRGNIADRTDGIAQDVLDAGTVTIGKTTTPEFGLPCYTEPATGAPARTPWDTRRTAGGSSGGAAAAVASGIVPIAQGSDGGGSIRIPAACCGIVGIKPSRGRVSSGPYGADGPGLVSDGILARSVRDAALGLDLIAHTRPGDPFPLPTQAGTFARACERESGPLRIGVLTEPLAGATSVHPAALRGVERAVTILRGLGHEVTEVGAPFTPEDWRTFMPVWSVGAASLDLPAEAEAMLKPLTRWLRERGREYDGRALAAAQVGVQMLGRRVAATFDGFDVVLTPTLSGPPAFPADLELADPAADFDAQCAFTPWTSAWNMSGRAALSLPLHREEIDGIELPFGVQLGAVRAADEDLSLATSLEASDPWPTRIPVVTA
jgi:amidase